MPKKSSDCYQVDRNKEYVRNRNNASEATNGKHVLDERSQIHYTYTDVVCVCMCDGRGMHCDQREEEIHRLLQHYS